MLHLVKYLACNKYLWNIKPWGMYYHLPKAKGSRIVLAEKGIYLTFSNIAYISQGAKITPSSQMSFMPKL